MLFRSLFKQVFPWINSQVTCQVLGLMLCPTGAIVGFRPPASLRFVMPRRVTFSGSNQVRQCQPSLNVPTHFQRQRQSTPFGLAYTACRLDPRVPSTPCRPCDMLDILLTEIPDGPVHDVSIDHFRSDVVSDVPRCGSPRPCELPPALPTAPRPGYAPPGPPPTPC